MKRIHLFVIPLTIIWLVQVPWQPCLAQVEVVIDAGAARKPISPNIYGKNNSLSNWFSKPMSESDFQFLRDAGVRMFRESGGNNSTKYNWRKKLSSHPDWYNNVYSQDWDYSARTMLEKIPGSNGMWTLPLIGKAARSNAANFNDWSYNGSQWWSGVNQNLAGGGIINPSGGNKAVKDGNPDLYLENWPPDSVVGILKKWFGPGGLGYDKTRIPYWNMDNEPEIWNGTHDDVMPTLISAEAFLQRYFETAKKARALFPEIKLAGPVPANEWQWYNWDGNRILQNGTHYTWLEYFIKRVADEQKSSGIRLLDILDIHFYPGETRAEDIVQLHRVYFDRNYVYPGANGVRRLGAGGWDGSINREYIFGRCNDWLVKYLGANHGVTFSVSETGINTSDANVRAVWYASTLGEFARQGVELFTPWDWKEGMWEVLHLFSRYNKPYYGSATSTDELNVSAHPSLNLAGDSITVVLINRSTTLSKEVNVRFNQYEITSSAASWLRLNGLPSSETFKSHSVNALKSGSVIPEGSSLRMTLPPLSVTSVQLQGKIIKTDAGSVRNPSRQMTLHPNPAVEFCTVQFPDLPHMGGFLTILSLTGQVMEERSLTPGELSARKVLLVTGGWPSGPYLVRLQSGQKAFTVKMTVAGQR